MTRFSKFDFSKLDFAKLDFGKFDFGKLDFGKFARPKDPEARGARTARMAEAMARLQRRQAAAYARWAEARAKAAAAPETDGSAGPTLDIKAPTAAGGAWTAPGSRPDEPAPAGPQHSAAFDLSGILRTVRDSLPKGAMPKGAMPEGLMPEGLGQGGGRPVTVPPGARFEERSFTGPSGTRSYKVYVPSGYTGQALPVLVMLHGCTQNPDDFAAGTGMNAVAEERTFLVAYPGQPKSANMQRCWNWYVAGDQRREGGEPELLAGIAKAVVAEFSADPTRVYAAGLSAGGAAAAILAATYPDVFAAVGVHSGLACGVARDVPSAFAAMKGNAGRVAPNGRSVPTIVFHGDGDRTVHHSNGEQVAAQAMAGAGLERTVSEGRTPDGVAYTRTVHTDATGRAVLEQWVLHGAGHAWSGGSPAGSFTDPRGPDASREMARFLLAHANATRH